MSWDHPVFILTHDRLVSVENLVEWLERAGCERIAFVDSGSTYEPLIEWLRGREEVYYLPNENRDAFWNHDLVPQDEPFAFCAPDVLPTEECPLNAFEYLWELLERYPQHSKAGAGIVYDDLEVVEGVRLGFAGRIGEYTVHELEHLESIHELSTGVCDSLVDHHFCVYRPGAGPAGNLQAIRTKAPSPYMVRHVPWYEDHPLTPDVTYYVKHAIRGGNFSSWLTGENASLVDA